MKASNSTLIDNEEHFGGSLLPYAGMPWIWKNSAYFQQSSAFHFTDHRLPPGSHPLPRLADRSLFRFTCTSVSRQMNSIGNQNRHDDPQPEIPGIWDRKTIQSITGLPTTTSHRISWSSNTMPAQLKGGLVYADAITTVSNTYAEGDSEPVPMAKDSTV